MKTISALLLGLTGLFFSSCDLENMMYHQTPVSSYNLRTDVIPASQREFVTMTSQGKAIYGYFIKSNGTDPSTTILYFHGNWDHLEYYWPRAELLYKTGCNVFIFDYQGYGMSEGTPTEQGLYSDCRAALDYVLSRNDVTRSKLVFFGFSLGCAGAVDLAATTFTPAALCLEAPYASSSALLQTGTLLNIPNSYVMEGEYDNAGKIKKVKSPLLIIHGETDNFIDIEKNGAVVYNNANFPKQFIRVPGADHEGIPATWGADNYVSAIRQFILQYIPAR